MTTDEFDCTLPFFHAPKATSRYWKAGEIRWSDLVDRAAAPEGEKETTGYVLGTFTGKLRRTSDLVSRNALTLDVDRDAGEGLLGDVRALGVRVLYHSTYSSAPDNPRARLIFPLSRPVSAAEYERIAVTVALRLGIDRFDRTSFRPAQFMWMPGALHRSWYQSEEVAGDLLDADATLDAYDPDSDANAQRTPRIRKQDPHTVPGVVGAFNRAHTDLDALIADFDLPYVMEGENRYRFAESESVAGMGPVDSKPGLYYSHHATDPAFEIACSAFDLVRIHRFGDEDIGASPGTPVHNLRSHKAMEEFALKDPGTKAELAASRGSASDDFDAIDPSAASAVASSWILALEVAKGGEVKTSIRNRDLVVKHDPIMSSLAYDEMSMSIVVRRRAPWMPEDSHPEDHPRPLGLESWIEVRHYIEREYGLILPQSEIDAMILTAAKRSRFNPLVDLLRGLKWDGVPRVETSLPGVGDSPYARLVARKVFVSAIARAFEPGIQADLSLLLYGPEGTGKSRWIRRVGLRPEWTSDLGRIDRKDTLQAMSTRWIIVSDEVDAMRRADFDALKSFLTKTHDTFRAPYERETGFYPRRCVVWGTTNDPKFLRRQQGNRRFLIVESADQDDRALDDEWVLQLWAEAVAMYDRGEPVFLTPDEEAAARDERARFTLEDPLIGQISHYLNALVPPNWDRMTPSARRDHLQTDPDSRLSATGETQQMSTSALAIWRECVQPALPTPLGERDLRQINAALTELPEWVPVGLGPSPYGPQELWARITDEDRLDDLEDLI